MATKRGTTNRNARGTWTWTRYGSGCQGGTYRRNNIRPACGDCNSETGGALRSTGRRVA